MREALWPDKSGSHADEVSRFFAAQLKEPIAVVVAEDNGAARHHGIGRALGFEEVEVIRCFRKSRILNPYPSFLRMKHLR